MRAGAGLSEPGSHGDPFDATESPGKYHSEAYGNSNSAEAEASG
jgi:hypothetical protein